MNDVSKVLVDKGNQNNCALIPFITAGYPSLKHTVDIIKILDQENVDVIELGIPYTDALADGPVIQETSKLALLQNVSIDDVLLSLKQVMSTIRAPIVIFTYFNPILSKGINNFIYDLYNSGVKGLIIPDLPFEEMDYIIVLCKKYCIELIFFIAPTSSEKRCLEIIDKAPGCIYLVSNTGVTGVRNEVNYNIKSIIKDLKKTTSKPIMLGFGISNAEQVQIVSQWEINGIVIGSALMQNILQSSSDTIASNVSKFIRNIKSGLYY